MTMMKPRLIARMRAAKNKTDPTPLEQEQALANTEPVVDDSTEVDGVENSMRELTDDAERDYQFTDSYDAATGRQKKTTGRMRPRQISYSSKPGPVIIGPRPLKPPGRRG